MKIVPELDFLNHCLSLFLLIEDNYRILIFLCRLKRRVRRETDGDCLSVSREAEV